MKATNLLIEHHVQLKSTFNLLLKGNGHSAELREKLATNLTAHMVIEQEIFYPAALIVNEELVLDGYEEHIVARFALRRLMKTPVTDRTFKAKVKMLKDLIEHHIQEEEEELFPRAEKAFGESSAALCAKMKTLYEATVKSGYERIVEPGGPALMSARAPSVAHA